MVVRWNVVPRAGSKESVRSHNLFFAAVNNYFISKLVIAKAAKNRSLLHRPARTVGSREDEIITDRDWLVPDDENSDGQ